MLPLKHEEYKIQTDQLERSEEEIELSQHALNKYGITLSDNQIAFRRHKKAEMKNLFRQEYPEDDQTCFLSSGNAAIDAEAIKLMSQSALPAIYSQDGLTIFEKCNRANFYVIGCDTAEGYEGDYSVAQVFDVRNLKQVAILRGHFKPYEFAQRINDLAIKYTMIRNNLPIVAVERNNHGHAVLLELSKHINYPSIFYDKDNKQGWLTDRISRPMMIDAFIDAVENQRIKLNCPITLQECLTLVEQDGRIEAGTSKKDDCVMAAAIALQLCISRSNAQMHENMASMIRI